MLCAGHLHVRPHNMSRVFIYAGSGRFVGGAFKWHSPTEGATHNFMLFLAQDNSEPNQAAALTEMGHFGFDEVDLREGRPLAVEALNDPQMLAFQAHYQGALHEGSSLVWYP